MLQKIFYYLTVFVFYCAMSGNAYGQHTYELDGNVPEIKLYNKLKLGGTSPSGVKIDVNNFYLSIGGTPVIPITGEFHFSRYPKQYWDESIRKMKAGGINVIATYVFWNVHEENEGHFEWDGDKDLKEFINLCHKNNIYVLVRIGPFCHGEIRNGGLPDWLLGKPLSIRSNDPMYLSCVQKFYSAIGEQLKGFYFKEGGPIIGIQIENEYQHSAAPWGLTYPGQPLDFTASERDAALTQEGVGISKEDNPYAELGNDHMKILKSLAVSAGMDVPLYTATGWGNAAIIPNECIPVTAAYAYPFWTPKRDYSPFFLYKDMHSQPDYAPVRYTPQDYPVFAAELGSGIVSIYSRRPIAVHKSFDAMINRCLGSGANGIGYYMYHGGSTPKGQNSYFSDEAYGLPKISYDFQAPVGEYGQVREGFHRLKLLHFFVQDFGNLLAPMKTVLPANAATLNPEDINSLRYAARMKGNSGFVFLNNFQDDTTMVAQKNIRLHIKTPKKDIYIPQNGSFDLDSDENVVFPFNQQLNGILLNYATAQLMAKTGQGNEVYYIFYAPQGVKSEFSFAGNVKVNGDKNLSVSGESGNTLVRNISKSSEFTVNAKGKTVHILLLDKEFALKAYRIIIAGRSYFAFSEAVVLEKDNGIQLLNDGGNAFEVSFYPKINVLPKTTFGSVTAVVGNDVFSVFKIILPKAEIPVVSRQVSTRKYTVSLPKTLPAYVNDAYLNVNYTADTAMGFLDGILVADEFYKGMPWQVGLRKFLNGNSQEIVFYFRPMLRNASYLVDLQPYPKSIPDFGSKKDFLEVKPFTIQVQYTTSLTF